MPVTPNTLSAEVGGMASGTTCIGGSSADVTTWSCHPSIPNTLVPTT
jgi:hypothetical protein